MRACVTHHHRQSTPNKTSDNVEEAKERGTKIAGHGKALRAVGRKGGHDRAGAVVGHVAIRQLALKNTTATIRG